MLSDEQRKRVFNIIILTQCLGMLSGAFFQNGFFLNYFSKLRMESASIAFLFALPSFIAALLMLPFAFLADRKGKVRLGLMGQGMIVGGLLLVLTAGRMAPSFVSPVLAGGILIFSVGSCLQGASWFALLNPLIPREMRGRFFGRLRVTFMTVIICFSILITKMLDRSQSMAVFQGIIGIVCLAQVARYFTYRRIPELEKEHQAEGAQSFAASLRSVFRISGFASFNSYVLLITLFTAAVPIVYGLMQKDVFGFSPAQIQLVGTLFLAGGVAGNLIGGRLVDRIGTRLVFLIAHISYSVILLCMLARHWIPLPLLVQVGMLSFLFNMLEGTKGIAITSEILELIPARNKSLSTAVCMTLFSLGIAASQLFAARAISWNVLTPEWTMFGAHFSIYDTLLLGFGGMILLMLLTIGLVPKVVKNVQLLPGSGYPRI